MVVLKPGGLLLLGQLLQLDELSQSQCRLLLTDWHLWRFLCDETTDHHLNEPFTSLAQDTPTQLCLAANS